MDTSDFADNYRLLARYNRWFNQRLFDACEQLTDEERKRDRGAFFGSIHNTLNHLIWGDQAWLKRFAAQGVAFEALPDSLLALPAGALHGTVLYENWAALRAQRERLDAAIEDFANRMPPDFPLRTMTKMPSASPLAKVASTTSTRGACHMVPKKKYTATVCWLFSAKAKSVKKMAALSSHMRYFTW